MELEPDYRSGGVQCVHPVWLLISDLVWGVPLARAMHVRLHGKKTKKSISRPMLGWGSSSSAWERRKETIYK